MHCQPPLQVHLGAHLLQLLACMGHSNWLDALGPSKPCQKLPVLLLVRVVLLLQDFMTWGTSSWALSSWMKVLQSSKAASLSTASVQRHAHIWLSNCRDGILKLCPWISGIYLLGSAPAEQLLKSFCTTAGTALLLPCKQQRQEIS